MSSKIANALRFLSIDAIEKAKSGHPGMPMGMADIATVLWREFLKHNPTNPNWLNRDRFVLSNGHGSMLLYALLHLTGYNLSIDDIKVFRQLNSKTPGHPENSITPGVETTTGPLGQGFANAVGMALAEKMLSAQFNHPRATIIDHYTYLFLGDGCLMEGISHEAGSLAGHHKLGKLIAFWDDNGISIDGHVKDWFTDNTPARFEAYGWHVIANVDGHDSDSIRKAIKEARLVNDKPSLICCKTIIGYGAPTLCNSSKSHGAPLGADEATATRKRLEWEHEPFVVPPEIYSAWSGKQKGQQAEEHWNDVFANYKKEYPLLAKELLRRTKSALPDDWSRASNQFIEEMILKQEDLATRKASQACINNFAPILPEMAGGSADLTGSNLTQSTISKTITPDDATGNYIYYGVREFAMFAIMNGIAAHGGFIPYGGTFLVFADYGKNAIRMSALMQQQVVYVLTHDSIGLGEDGPTHQPIEHLTMLRTIPNVSVWRPCDLTETAIAWKYAIENKTGPTCLILTRQKVATQAHSTQSSQNISRGGYILYDCEKTPEIIIIATGSEVDVAIKVARDLNSKGRNIRVVSMPSTTTFDQQDNTYKEDVLPKAVTKRVAIEAGHSDFWHKYVGLAGKIIGIDVFGKSAPAQKLFAEFQITEQNVRQLIETLIKQRGE